ncbi:AAA family ATPase [Vibrio fluvialis]|jgi:pilus assembly protein CpaE|uniref:Flp pilus assembly protein, ATPase CpaE n=2 Tax=Vibrio fluvialis TaxID=676 RepID=A0AAX2LQU6_VIBFL|nr:MULTISPECIES: AAA family ATPase [Vibrio]EKO3369262.1 AAA family ATPase [Vibrio fluvialis]EKO3370930.1 AAA family ATPase [Vibrio fluvialis]EKO3381765.1 AAA family ATPase [Vibrio fluvialis]EKO3386183.1 AAA family ATPase [Vibrio fluvialis]EKO3394664.1 AAA family ATPase [Vibrio fluvialis]
MGEAVKLSRGDSSNIRLKTSLSVWVLYSSDRFKLHMMSELSKCHSISYEVISLHGVMSESFKHFSPPDLIFVETGPNWAQKVIELQNYESPEVEEDDVNTSLIVFGDESDNGALKIALRIGAADFVSDRSSLEDLIPLLKNAAEEKIAARKLGQLFVFLNTKGGSGATTIALNTAVEVALQHKNKVLLLDLDIHFGVIMDYLNINPVYSINDAIANVADLDEISLHSLVSKHSSGLHVLSFKHENHNENFDKAMQLGKLLPTLMEYYPYIFVDLSIGVDRMFSPVLSHSSKVFLVTQQNLVGIKNTSRIAKSLMLEYGISKEQIELIVNRYEKRQQIKLKDIEQTITGVKVHMIPNDFKAAIESANLGKPVVESKKNSSITKSVIELSQTLAPEVKEKKGWIKRLFS